MEIKDIDGRENIQKAHEDGTLDEMCMCGHLKSEHGDHLIAIGHGECKVKGCPCEKFTWVKFVVKEQEKSTRPEGWGWPMNMRKAHYFQKGDMRSLCLKVLYFGHDRELGNDDSADNCSACKKKLAKLKREEEKAVEE